MKDFMFLFRGGFDDKTDSPEELQKATVKWRTWTEQLMKEKRLVPGQRLTMSAKVIRGRKKLLQDGPFPEGKEVVASFCTVKAANLDEAVEIAKGCPIFEYDGTVEVREVFVY